MTKCITPATPKLVFTHIEEFRFSYGGTCFSVGWDDAMVLLAEMVIDLSNNIETNFHNTLDTALELLDNKTRDGLDTK